MRQLIRTLKSLGIWLFITLDTILWSILSALSIFISPSGRLSHGCMRWWSNTILWICGIKIHVEGVENISKKEVQIFASNHQSFFDIWVLNKVIPVKFGWVMKKELARIPFLGLHMKINGYVSIDRKNKEKSLASMERAAEQIKGGNRIMIFPEGTRSKNGELLPFKKGLFHLCQKTTVPVVPIYIFGTENILRSGSMLVHRGTVSVKIGKPMPTATYTDNSIEDMMQDLRSRIISLKEIA